ncbi:MAG: glycosyltransferase [Candidatus Helarchaeota archaeon]
MKNNSFFIVWLGESGFPYGLAAIRRSLLISKSLVEVGVNVTVINRIGVHNPGVNINLERKGIYEGINYIYTSGTPYRPGNFVKRNLLKIVGFINELKFLRLIHDKKELDAAIVSTMQFSTILLYRIISKVLNFPLILNYVELNSAIITRKNILYKINDYFYEKFAFNLIDGVLPISNYLVNFLKKRSPKKAFLKVPVLCDFKRFNSLKRINNEKYFIFCGAAGYIDIIIFILKSFDLLDTQEKIYLYLVVNGNSDQLMTLKNEIRKINRRNYVKTFTNLSNKSLAELYMDAIGMLIPLRPTSQDHARFPHKIGEYTASGNPIITTNYGEIKTYFVDNETALIAKHYDIHEFANKMSFVISNPKKAKIIGQRGKYVGIKNFNYENYGKKIKSFILSLKIQG